MKEYDMEKYAELIAVLLEHSQRFIDFWNLQLVIALGVVGYSLAIPQIVSELQVRLILSGFFIAIAAFSIFSLSAHQKRAEMLWTALEARVAAEPNELITEEVAYIDSLKPTAFSVKAGALLTADVVIVLLIWFIPKLQD